VIVVVAAGVALATSAGAAPADDTDGVAIRIAEEVFGRLIAEHGGRPNTQPEDGMVAVFDHADEALDASLAVLRALQHHNAVEGAVAVHPRFGLHAVTDDSGSVDASAAATTIAARLRDVAGEGEVVVSAAIQRLAFGHSWRFRSVGGLPAGEAGQVEGFRVEPAGGGRRGEVAAHVRPTTPLGVLRSRLLRPRVPENALPRTRLVSRVRVSLDTRLVVVVAGAGYGKSTVLAQVVADDPRPCIWLSCDERLRATDAFLAHLAEGIGAVFPGLGRLPRGGRTDDLLTAMSNEVAETVADEIVVVVDDVQTILGSPAADALALLVSDLPPNVHFAMASRSTLPTIESRTPAAGVVRFTEDDLALDADECAALLQHHARPEGAPDAEELHARTEGWVAGVILGARVPVTRMAAGADEEVFDFLAGEVLAGQPEDVAAFLLDTAVLDRFTPSIAESITGRPGAELIVQWLVEHRLFCLALGGDGTERWYRYHHLLQAFLLRRLRATAPAREQDLRRRAGEALLAAGELLDAIPQFIAAGDLETAARRLAPVAEGLVRTSHAGALRAWLAAVPAEIRDAHPSLVLAQASLLFVDATTDEAFDALERAIETLLAAGDHERAALVLARLIMARVAAGLGVTRGIEAARRYVDRIEPSARMLPVARILLAGGYGWTCRFDDAERELSAALMLPAAERFPLAHTYAEIVRAHLIDRIRGSVSEAPDRLEDAIRKLEADPADADLGFLVYASGYRAFALSYVGRHEEALVEADRQAAAAERTGQGDIAENAGAWIRMVAFAELERWDDLERQLDVARESKQLRDWAMGYYFHAQRARLLAQRGTRQSVREEIGHARRAMERHLGSVDFNALGDLSLAAWAAGMENDARALAREARDVARASGAAWGQARGALLLANVDESPTGDEALAEALELTNRHGYQELWYRKERACASRLLARAVAHGIGEEDEIEDLVALCGSEVLDELFHDRRAAVRDAAVRVQAVLADGPRPPLRIEGFGGMVVRRRGSAVPRGAFGRDIARQLLAALVCSREPLPRDRLQEWLWPDLPPDRGARAFRTALHALRRALQPERPPFGGGSVIQVEADVCTLALEPADSVDVHEFLKLAGERPQEDRPQRIARLRAADAHVRGTLFPEWPYADWVAGFRREVEEIHGRVLSELGRALLEDGRADEAAECFRRLVNAEPEREEWHRRRMQALAAAGEVALALRQFHACRAILRRELAVEPSVATRDLYRDILVSSV
jgi:DNA-binding SARP family transcriptional activator